jgi:glycosyltransferase involved in cell wall biosynthesis
MPKVSVLSPTYRHAAYIGDCIQSVLDQTEQDWEMIIVDDGSDDGTADIAESFQDSRIVVLRRKHEGVSGLGRAYAAGLKRAKSPLIAILECDDTWPSDKLELQLPLFEDNRTVLSYGSAGLMDEQGCLYATYHYTPRGQVAQNDPIGSALPTLVRRDFIVGCTAMIRRSALEQIGGFVHPPGFPYVDLPTWLHLASLGTFAPSSATVGNWRRHARQITSRGWFEKPRDRTPFLQAAAEDARTVVTPSVFTSLEGAIRRDPSRQREEALLFQGRIALLEGRWANATTSFRRVLRSGHGLNRVVGAVGVMCAGGRTDMERFVDMAGGHSLPSRRHLESHGREGKPLNFAIHLK